MLKKSFSSALPVYKEGIDSASAKKIINSYTEVFKELEDVYQVRLEFSKEDSTLKEAKFIEDIDMVAKFGAEPADLLMQNESLLSTIKLEIQIFITCFNELEQLQRTIIYYTYFKGESAVKIAQLRLSGKQTYSTRTIQRKSSDAVLLLIKKIRWHQIKHQSVVSSDE